jgi:peptide/nickel transport system substrate-binding protein
MLVVALGEDIAGTDPTLAVDPTSAYVMQQVMEGLVRLRPGSSEIVPALAERWEVSPDGLTYRFVLRDGARFHDGTPVDAAAAKANFDRWLGLPPTLRARATHAARLFGGDAGTPVASVAVVDPRTIDVVLSGPRPEFLTALTLPAFGLSSPAALAAGRADNSEADPERIPYAQGGPPAMVGAGPFRFQEWVRGDHVTLVRNDDYWDPEGVPHLEQVVYRPVSSAADRLERLTTGEVDLVPVVPTRDLPAVEGNFELTVVTRPPACATLELAVNQSFAPVRHGAVREAMGHAIDRPALADAVFGSAAGASDSWLPAAAPSFVAVGLPDYDPQRAAELIKESGEPDLAIDLFFPSAPREPYLPDPAAVVEHVAGDLEAAGFTVHTHPVAQVEEFDSQAAAGAYEAWLAGRTCRWGTPQDFLADAFTYRDGAPRPAYAYPDPEVDAAIRAAASAPDEAAATAGWQRVQQLLRADLPTLPLIDAVSAGAARTDVRGLIGGARLDEPLNEVWLDR